MPSTIENPQRRSSRLKSATRKGSSASVGELLERTHELEAKISELQESLRVALNGVDKPAVVLPELHDTDSGRIDAQKIADFMGVPLKQLSEGLGLNYKAVHRNTSAAGFQKALRPVKKTLELLQEFFGTAETIRVWLNTPHPDLDGASALEIIMEGKVDAVTLILENAWNGVPV